jgi:hypothetical protein
LSESLHNRLSHTRSNKKTRVIYETGSLQVIHSFSIEKPIDDKLIMMTTDYNKIPSLQLHI